MAKGKYNKKRNYKKKVPRNYISAYPFPKTKVAKLRYVEQITLDPTVPSVTIGPPPGITNGMALATFRANSCYDPNYSLGLLQGHPRS